MVIDFEASRCPNVQVALNSVLTAFLASGRDELTLRTVEPSFERSLIQRIVHRDLPLKVERQDDESITPVLREHWLERYDDEDLEDVDTIHVFTLTRAS